VRGPLWESHRSTYGYARTLGSIWAIDIAIVLPNPATGHSLGHFHGLVFLLEPPVCNATKSSVFPRVLFILLRSFSLERAVEDGRPVFTSLSESETCMISMRALDVGGLRNAPFPAFAFTLAKAVALAAFIVAYFSAFSFTVSSFYVITAAVNSATSTNLYIFFFF
jgi:hypothetical protein